MTRSLRAKIEDANAAIMAGKNLDAIGDFFAPGYVAHGTDQDLQGHAGIRRFVALVQRAFPVLTVEVEILVEGTDRVAWQRTLRGVQTGAFMGFPASNREIVWRDMVTSRFENGVIAEDWVITDLAERLLLARKA